MNFNLERGNPLANAIMMEKEFLHIRSEFLSVARVCIDESILSVLKKHYEHYIDSNRKLSQIKDIIALLKVLEKRDVLSCNNIEPLVYISNNFLNDPLIQKKLNDYKIYLQNKPYTPLYNMYQDLDEDNEASKESSHKHVDQKTNYSEDEIALQQILLLHISERIGRSWRDTVRYLGLQEYQIDVIQNNHAFDLKEQSYQALKLCISQDKSGNWKLNLIQALEKARRRDLKEFAENLIIGFKK
ncbi:Fas-associated death domain protein [Anthophora quadrimaculata]